MGAISYHVPPSVEANDSGENSDQQPENKKKWKQLFSFLLLSFQQTGYIEGQPGQTQAKKAKLRPKKPKPNNLPTRKKKGGVETIEMMWWWRENDRNVVVVVVVMIRVERKQ